MMRATMDEVLHERAHRPDRGFAFLDDDGTTRRSFAALDRRASSIGAQLAATMVPGSRAILLYPPSIDFIDAFFGAVRAGVIAVPLSPPVNANLTSWVANVERVIDDTRPDVVLTNSVLLGLKAAEGLQIGPPGLPWIATDSIEGDDDWEGVHPSADDVALLQFTSGSTTQPKGVVLSHANLMANQRVAYAGFDVRDDDVVVSWLPLFHDMGLIGMIMQSVYSGLDCYLFSPLDFLRRPARWLEVMTQFGGTSTGAPNFAYELCIRRTSPEEREALDLSAWRLAFTGAEPVRPSTLRRFAQMFAPVGFRETAFVPCYGLAEASVYVTASPAGELARVARATSGGLATPDESVGAKEISSVGMPGDDHHILVVDPTTEQPVDDGRVGEIWVSGPSVSQGYWRRPDDSARTFGVELGGRRWLRTGDLGFLADGHLYISGRMREVISVRGRNIFPVDIEDAVQNADARLRPGCGAAFGVDDDDCEGVVIVQETREEDSDELEQLLGTIRRALADVASIVPLAVVLVPPHALPKTSSGKLQRLRCREEFIGGTLPSLRVWNRPSLQTAGVASEDSGS